MSESELEKQVLPTTEIGDGKPLVEDLGEGAKRFTIRVVRPPVRSTKPLSQIVEQMKTQQEMIDKVRVAQEDTNVPDDQKDYREHPERQLSHPDYKADIWYYKQLFPKDGLGTPESLPMIQEPKVSLTFVRHLDHIDNVLKPGVAEAYQNGMAQNLVDDLQVDAETLVVVINSATRNLEGRSDGSVNIHSRTGSTVDVIKQVLQERNIPYIENLIQPTLPIPKLQDGELVRSPNAEPIPVVERLKIAVSEFEVIDNRVYQEAIRRRSENQKAKAANEIVPYPGEQKNRMPVVQASDEDSATLEYQTGMKEVASATIAKVMAALEGIEKEFIDKDGNVINVPDGVKKLCFIIGSHGQFMINISEAWLIATDKKFPIIIAQNGAYEQLHIGRNKAGQIVEEYVTETGDRTGMRLI